MNPTPRLRGLPRTTDADADLFCSLATGFASVLNYREILDGMIVGGGVFGALPNSVLTQRGREESSSSPLLLQTGGLFGGPLSGGKPLRSIYIDEAGTSAREPVSVVVGIVIQPDKHWLALNNALNEALAVVPDEYRENFVFHAKAVWGDKRLRNGWSKDQRLELLHTVMALPHKYGAGVVMGMVRRKSQIPPMNLKRFDGHSVDAVKIHHVTAFEMCVIQADEYIINYCNEGELGTVIAEDVPEMRNLIRLSVDFRKKNPVRMPVGLLRAPQDGLVHSRKFGERVFGISRIIEQVNFVAKEGCPIVQIADACAFGFRRFLANQDHGHSFAKSIVGYDLDIREWSGNSSLAKFPPIKDNNI